MKEDLLKQIADIKALAAEEIRNALDSQMAESLRVKYLGRKGIVTLILKSLGSVDPLDRPLIGREINELKSQIESELKHILDESKNREQYSTIQATSVDVTLKGRFVPRGHFHPARRVMGEITRIFAEMGFSTHTGPEIETDYYNFEALNFLKDHPARDMQDTFYVSGGHLLRTHTSPVQIHVMEKLKPPIYAVFPGAVYRRDSDITHSPMFHQVEGLAVAPNITMGDLKGVLAAFCREMFGGRLGVRFRPSFFPFTEPSAEVDIQCVICGGGGCRVCKNTGWLEILGAGMVDPNVFLNVGVSPKEMSGFAFGMGVERIAMLKYAISDIRLFFENDMRFLEQF